MLAVLVMGMVLVSESSLVVGERCNLGQHREMQNEFRKCSRGFSNDSSLSPCKLVTKVVETCGEEWRACHGSKEVRQMRDLHIEALVRQYGGEEGKELAECPVVREYRESGRTLEGGGEEIVCNDLQTLQIQQSFQNCSHEISTAVYEASLHIESSKLLAAKLCKALTDIGTVCVKHLRECFARDDVIQMKRSSLLEMKDFLIRIVNGKVEDDALDDCKAGLDAVDTLEEYDDDEYDEPQVVLQGESGGNNEEASEEISEKEEADSAKEEDGDAVESSTEGGSVGGLSGKEHRSVGQVEEVTTAKVDQVVGEVKKENKVEESEEGLGMVEGKEEAVRRPEKIQDRTGSSERLTASTLLPLLLVPVFLNL